MRELTELECTVLGVLAKFGPQSPYAVRRHFADSPATRFSASTGSIYPSLKRLEEAGLVESRESARGRQARREVSITAAGKKALRRWLAGPPGREEFDAPPDPLRTRLYFLGLLSRAKQEEFLDGALSALREQLDQSEAYLGSSGSQGPEGLSRLAARGAVFATRARIQWLEEVRRKLLGG